MNVVGQTVAVIVNHVMSESLNSPLIKCCFVIRTAILNPSWTVIFPRLEGGGLEVDWRT